MTIYSNPSLLTIPVVSQGFAIMTGTVWTYQQRRWRKKPLQPIPNNSQMYTYMTIKHVKLQPDNYAKKTKVANVTGELSQHHFNYREVGLPNRISNKHLRTAEKGIGRRVWGGVRGQQNQTAKSPT
jgi:hypothetical protein